MSFIDKYKDVLYLLIKLIYILDFKDSYLKTHSENTAYYIVLLGKELNLDKNDLTMLKIGAFLHDIGKIAIPDYLLIKEDTISDSEFETIKSHVIFGESLLSIEGLNDIKMMARSHHERYDGKGYPDGLKGDEIPYFARILSVVDTFDAMTTQRSYNKIKTSEEAFQELIKVSNNKEYQQLDPHLVKAFINAIKKDKESMNKFKLQDENIISNRNKFCK